MNHLSRQKVTDALEDAFSDNPLFPVMRGAAIRLYNNSRDTALNHSELFYHVVFTLDSIKSTPAVEARKHCGHDLWDELIYCLMEGRNANDKGSAQKNAAAIMTATSIALVWSGMSSLVPVAEALLSSPNCNEPDYAREAGGHFLLSFRDADRETLGKYISGYMQSDEMLSRQADELLDSLHEDEVEPQSGSVPDIRLAEGKRTHFIFAVEAMCKAGWIVDAEGKAPRSKDKAIGHILQQAFGVQNPNIAQLRSAARNRNKGTGPRQYLEELVRHL